MSLDMNYKKLLILFISMFLAFAKRLLDWIVHSLPDTTKSLTTPTMWYGLRESGR